ncbi:MAG: S26 family signal peptidase [bacterium]|nr:S26 family signal peptidase [bacterium]
MNRNKRCESRILRILAESILAVLALKHFVLSPFIMSGESMNDSLKENDVIFALKMPAAKVVTLFSEKKLESFISGKVVVIENGGNYLAKRCAGVFGDTLVFLSEERADTFIVPSDSIFVIGDNFRNSNDSRSFGFVSKNKISGVGFGKINPFYKKI